MPINSANSLNVKEIPFFLCAKDNNAERIYTKIKELREKYGFDYSNEIVYELFAVGKRQIADQSCHMVLLLLLFYLLLYPVHDSVIELCHFKDLISVRIVSENIIEGTVFYQYWNYPFIVFFGFLILVSDFTAS